MSAAAVARLPADLEVEANIILSRLGEALDERAPLDYAEILDALPEIGTLPVGALVRVFHEYDDCPASSTMSARPAQVYVGRIVEHGRKVWWGDVTGIAVGREPNPRGSDVLVHPTARAVLLGGAL